MNLPNKTLDAQIEHLEDAIEEIVSAINYYSDFPLADTKEKVLNVLFERGTRLTLELDEVRAEKGVRV